LSFRLISIHLWIAQGNGPSSRLCKILFPKKRPHLQVPGIQLGVFGSRYQTGVAWHPLLMHQLIKPLPFLHLARGHHTVSSASSLCNNPCPIWGPHVPPGSTTFSTDTALQKSLLQILTPGSRLFTFCWVGVMVVRTCKVLDHFLLY
jgi:hypothetical protein